MSILRVKSPARRRLDAATAVLVVTVTAGIAIRLGFWWQDRAFWRDELGLVQSLDTYTLRELWGPLSDAQAAPPMWLWTERAITTLLGTGELAYRLLPVLAGCVALALVGVLALELVRYRWAALVPVALLATTAVAVFYGAQTKQYTTDLMLVSALLLLAVWQQTRPSRRAYDLAWYVCLAVFPWFSYGAMLTVPLVAAWVAVIKLRRGHGTVGRTALWLAVPAVSTLLAALHARSLTSRVEDFSSYWANYLGPRTLDVGAWVEWHGFVFREVSIRLLGAPLWWAPLLLATVGLVALWRRSHGLAMLLVLPILAAYLAAVTGFYPFGRRLGLFFVPSIVLAIGVFVDAAAGVAVMWFERLRRPPSPDRMSRSSRGAAVVAGLTAAALVAVTCWTTPAKLGERLRYQYGVDDYRTAFEWVGAHWEAGDILLVGNEDRTAARVYGPRLGLPADAMYRAMPASGGRKRDDCPLPPEVGAAPRAWLVTGDLVELYAGVTSRYGLVAPLIGRFHVIYQHVRGQVTVQLVEAERMPKPENAHTVRCLDYAPVGVAGDPEFPPALPSSAS